MNDLAVAADGAIESLQIAVDDKDQIVELFSARERDGPERFWLVAFAVTQKRPHLATAGVLDSAILEVFVEASLIDRHDRAEAHRDRGKLPEIGHQPGVWIARKAPGRLQLSAKVLQIVFGEPTFEKGARVHARRRMTLKVNQVAAVAIVASSAKKVIEANFVQRGGRRKSRDVSTQPIEVLVGAVHHRHRVPANDAFDASFELAIPRIARLLAEVDRVDIGRVEGMGQLHPLLPRFAIQDGQKLFNSLRTFGIQDIFEGVEPLLGFRGINVVRRGPA